MKKQTKEVAKRSAEQAGDMPILDARAVAARGFTPKQVAIIRGMISEDINDDELTVFLMNCRSWGLDPFKREAYAVKYKGRLVTQVGIDGHLRWAMETGRFRGFTEPMLLVTVKGKEKEDDIQILHSQYNPRKHEIVSATCAVIFDDGTTSEVMTCLWDGYVQLTKEGRPNQRWQNGGDRQLIKGCHALLIRTNFPGMGGEVFAPEEMGHVERTTEPIDIKVTPVDQEDGEQASLGEKPQKSDEEAAKTYVEKKLLPMLKRQYPLLEKDTKKLSEACFLLASHLGLESLKQADEEQLKKAVSYAETEDFVKEMRGKNILPIERQE